MASDDSVYVDLGDGQYAQFPKSMDKSAIERVLNEHHAQIGSSITKKIPAASVNRESTPGYFQRLGQSMGIPTSAEELKSAIPSLPRNKTEAAEKAIEIANPAAGMVTNAIGSTKDYLQGAGKGLKRGYEEATEAGVNIGEGGSIPQNIGKAASGVAEAATSLVPFVGAPTWQAGVDWFNRNYRGALGGMTGTMLQVMLASKDVREALGKVGTASPENAIEKLNKALDTPGGKGGERAARMASDLDVAKADLADISKKTPLEGKGAYRFHELAENVGAKQDQIWEQSHTPQVQRWRYEPTDTEALVKAADSSLPPELEDAAPEETAKAREWIQSNLGKPRNLQQLDKYLRDLNSDIRGKKYEAYGPKGILVRQAAAKAIRAEIDNVLERHGEPGVREVNRRWGALENIRNRAEEMAVQQARIASKNGELPQWAQPYLFIHPDWGVLSGISANLSKIKRSPAGRLQSGMEELGRSKLESPGSPDFRLVSPPGRGIQPSQPELIRPELEKNFSPRGRSDATIPSKKATGTAEKFRGEGEGNASFGKTKKPLSRLKKGDTWKNHDGTLYVYDGRKWVKAAKQ